MPSISTNSFTIALSPFDSLSPRRRLVDPSSAKPKGRERHIPAFFCSERIRLLYRSKCVPDVQRSVHVRERKCDKFLFSLRYLGQIRKPVVFPSAPTTCLQSLVHLYSRTLATSRVLMDLQSSNLTESPEDQESNPAFCRLHPANLPSPTGAADRFRYFPHKLPSWLLFLRCLPEKSIILVLEFSSKIAT